MTERLYYHNSYLKTFAAKKLLSIPQNDGFAIILDQTAFYPTSGGQPNDLGRLGDQEILDVVEDDNGDVVHLVRHEVTAGEPTGQIDWERRHDHMQQHTGQHLLSQAFLTTARFNTIGFHLSSDYATIDLDSDSVSRAQLERAEKLVNEIISENRTVSSRIVPPEEVPQLGLRKESRREGSLRIVCIEDFDVSACGGTHVRQTAEVGGIVIRTTERVNRQVRVEFICGNRILKSHRLDLEKLTAVARQFSVGLAEVPERVEKQIRENKNLRKKLQEKNKVLAELLARELYRSAKEYQGFKIVKELWEDEEIEFLKLVIQALHEQGPVIALLGCRRGEQANLIFSQVESSPYDLRNVLAESCKLIEGRGGGSKSMAQGGGRKVDQLEAALILGEQLILS
jgi:alanyl-tRNA synthetase